MALSSLLLNHRQADITATDYPTVEYFLDRNTTLNNNRGINFERLDWSEDNSHLGRFDIIIGSDSLRRPTYWDIGWAIERSACQPVKSFANLDAAKTSNQ